MELRQVFTTPDGAQFDTKAEAMDYLRRPKILAALKALTAGNEELAEWLLENQETVECAFDTGTIRRVTKAEYAKLDKALEALKEIEGNTKIAFLQEHTAAIRESFRWPSVKRMNDEEKLAAAHTTLTEAAENEELASWILENKTEILEAYKAGVEKRQVSEKATAGLAAYRAKKAQEKAEREAAEAAAKEAEQPSA